MKYLILIYHSREVQVSEAEMEAGMQAHGSLVQDLSESGELVVAEVLVDPSQGKRVSVVDGRASVTDGPFAEVKEHLAGVYVVECDDIDQAIAHAARLPEAAGGLVEVRQVAVEATPERGWRDVSQEPG